MDIRSLAYLGISSGDVDAWRECAENILGAPTIQEKDDALYVRLDNRHHRISVSHGESAGLEYMGWDVPDERALYEAAATLEAAGLAISEGSEKDCQERRVQGFVWTTDPAGHRVEISHGQLWLVDRPLRPTRNITGLIGLGHVVFGTPAHRECVDFYTRVLGLRMTDYRNDAVFFLRCNDRHHSLAIARSDVTTLHHFFVEVESIDDVGWTYDLVRACGRRITAEFGKHANDLAVSFYFEGPDGIQIEYGTGGLRVDDSTWVAHEFSNGDLWGHQRLCDEPIVTAPPSVG